MNTKNTLTAIKQQLVDQGELLLAQRQFLIDAISRIESGESLDQAFNNAIEPSIQRGKKSHLYLEAKQTRDIRLMIAFTYMNGSDWQKCEQLAQLTNEIIRKNNAGLFVPKSEPERIILRIIRSGTRPLTTSRSIFRVIFRKN